MVDALAALEGQAKGGQALSTLHALRELRERLPDYAIQPSLGMQYAEQNKYVTWRFPESFKTVELLHVTDVQFGHVECRVHRLIEYRDWLLSKPNRFALFGGDMIDASTIFSPGEPWENICNPQRQIYKFCELIAPLRARILGYVGGNHERRGIKTFGDVGILIATLLQIPYSSGQQLIDIYFGKHRPFKLHLWHGRGAARTDGAQVQMIAHFMKDHPGSDLYLIGHLHNARLTSRIVSERIPEKLNIHMRKSFGVMSTSFISYWSTYAEVAGMSATDVLMWRAVLDPKGWEMTIR